MSRGDEWSYPRGASGCFGTGSQRYHRAAARRTWPPSGLTPTRSTDLAGRHRLYDGPVKFIDWFADKSVYVVDLALACCGVESGAAVPTAAPTCQDAPSGAPVVAVVSGTISTVLAPVVRSTIETLREDHPVDVVAFGACSCAGGPYWDSAAVVDGLPAIGVEADHWIPGCPPAPDALTGFLSSSREAA